MFNNIGWGEMLLLVVVGLVVLGPERLPGAIRWASGAVRQTRDYLSGATNQLREELGPEFDQLREPLSELQKLRGMTPRAALTKHLLDGDDSWLTGNFDTPAVKPQSSPHPVGDSAGQAPSGQAQSGQVPSGQAPSGQARSGAPAPFDPDAT